MNGPPWRFDRHLLVALVYATLLLQRFAIPLGGFRLALVTPLWLGAVVVWLLKGGAGGFDRDRTVLYLVSGGLLLGSSLLAISFGAAHSLTSVLFLLLLYSVFVYRRSREEDLGTVLRHHQAIMVVLALLGILQFVLQLGGRPFFDPISDLPAFLLMQGFNTHIPLFFGATTLKSNAVVFLEPSFFSKALAAAIIIEAISGQGRPRLGSGLRILVLFAALFTSFSGTGWLALAATAPWWFVRFTPRGITAPWGLHAVALVAAAVFIVTGFAALVFERIEEFTQPGTSGYKRFVSSFAFLVQAFGEPSIWFGTGAGSVHGFETEASLYANSLVKLIIEYGLVGGLGFLVFVLWVFFHGRQRTALAVLVFTIYFFLTGALLQPQTALYCFLLSGLVPRTPRPAAAAQPAEPTDAQPPGAPPGPRGTPTTGAGGVGA